MSFFKKMFASNPVFKHRHAINKTIDNLREAGKNDADIYDMLVQQFPYPTDVARVLASNPRPAIYKKYAWLRYCIFVLFAFLFAYNTYNKYLLAQENGNLSTAFYVRLLISFCLIIVLFFAINKKQFGPLLPFLVIYLPYQQLANGRYEMVFTLLFFVLLFLILFHIIKITPKIMFGSLKTDSQGNIDWA